MHEGQGPGLLCHRLCYLGAPLPDVGDECARRAVEVLLAVEAVIVTGSGTAAFEGALVSSVPAGAKVVNASAGKFSERWGEMAGRLGYDRDQRAKALGRVAGRGRGRRRLPGR